MIGYQIKLNNWVFVVDYGAVIINFINQKLQLCGIIQTASNYCSMDCFIMTCRCCSCLFSMIQSIWIYFINYNCLGYPFNGITRCLSNNGDHNGCLSNPNFKCIISIVSFTFDLSITMSCYNIICCILYNIV